MLRARYNAFIACCPGREPKYYLNDAMKVIEEMEYFIEKEKPEQGIVDDVAKIKQDVQNLLDGLVPNPAFQRWQNQQNAAARIGVETRGQKKRREQEAEAAATLTTSTPGVPARPSTPDSPVKSL
jgi:hypothetical protein